MLCYAMLCYAMLCYAMLCYAMLCYAMLCYAMLFYAILCYAMLCFAMLCYAMLCYAMLCYAMLCYAMLCYAMPEKDIARLQRFQNCLARVVTKAPRFSRSTPVLKRLHLLPIKFRIHFKICTITFRTLKDNQPAYVSDLLVHPKCSKHLIYAPQIQIELLFLV